MSKEKKQIEKKICKQIDTLQEQLKSCPDRIKKELKQEILNPIIGLDDSRFTRERLVETYGKMITTAEKYSKKCGIDLDKLFSELDDNSKNTSKNPKHSSKELENFVKLYRSVLRLKRGLENGIKGENEAYKAIKILDDEIGLFQNLCVPFLNGTEEHDLIAVTTRGIFTLEVKYFSAKYVTVTKQGLVYIGNGYVGESSTNSKKRPKNVIEQAQRHKHSLRRLLKNTEFEDVYKRQDLH